MLGKLFGRNKKVISDEQQAMFQRQQSEIYSNIGKELIAATPEHWNSAILELLDRGETVAHTIVSDEGHPDIVSPTMDLFEHTRKLELLFKQYKTMFKSASFRVWLNENNEWQFNVQYEYHT